MGLKRDMPPWTWKFSGEFSLSLWGGTLGQVLCPELTDTGWLPMHSSSVSWHSASLSPWWGFPPFSVLPALLHVHSLHAYIFPQNIHIKEKLHWCFLWLVTYEKLFHQNLSDSHWFSSVGLILNVEENKTWHAHLQKLPDLLCLAKECKVVH